MRLICLLVLVPPRTWPMRSYWRWARPSRWPISWLCRPRGPSSTRTHRRDWLQTWWRPGPANLCPDRVAAFGSQRWVGLRAAQKQREWKLLKRCLYLNTDFEKKNADAVAQVEEKYESLKNDFSPDCSHLHQLQTHHCNATGHLLRNVYVFQFRKGWLITRASLPPWFHSEIRGKDLSLRRLPFKWHE